VKRTTSGGGPPPHVHAMLRCGPAWLVPQSWYYGDMEFKPEDQYLSMIRAYAALQRLATDTGGTAVMGHEPADAAKRFFTDCYHFKDYLKKDTRIPDPKSVELFLSGSTPLSIAADMCNAFKHAGLDKAPRGPGGPDKLNVAHTLLMPAGMPAGTAIGQLKMEKQPADGDSIALATRLGLRRTTATARVIVTVVGKQYDALAVGQECIEAWDHFLNQHGLTFQKTDT
jgi:hypothetical protein